MTLSDLSIKNPVFAWMLMLGLIAFGAISFNRMGISQLPDVDYPVVSVRVTWEGAAPEVVETEVTDVIEDAVMSVEGIKEVSSSSRQGQSNINIEFQLNRDIDVALQEVQTKIAQAQRNLPAEIDPPVITKSNPEDQPIMWVALTGDRPTKELMEYTKDRLKDSFTTVPGVGEVFLGGYIEPNLRVWLNKDKMRVRELTVDDVIETVRTQHSEVPAGRIETPKQELNIRVMGEAATVEEFQRIIIPARAGGGALWKTYRIGDVGTVEDGLDDIRRISRSQGQPAVGLGIRKQRGSNAVAVAKAVKVQVAKLKPGLPQGMDLNVVFDTTKFIEESTHELTLHLALAAVLTGVVCWVFLGSLSSTFNVLMAIPVSVVGAFTILYFSGFTLNTFTMLGLTLAIGIVVDDAIMVLENIVRYREKGLSKVKAALVGAREITSAAVAATIAVLAIFIPVIFMPGIVGKFLFQFGVTMSVAVALSLIEALTIAPMRCSQFLQVGHTTRIGKVMDAAMERMSGFYKAVIAWILNPQHNGRKPASPPAKIYAALLALAAGAAAIWVGYFLNYHLFVHALKILHLDGFPWLPSVLAVVHMAFWPLFIAWRKHRMGFLTPFFGFFAAIYRHALDRTVLVVIMATVFFTGSMSLFRVVKKEFVPSQDQSRFLVRLQTPTGSSLDFTNQVFKTAEAKLLEHPVLARYFCAVGGFGGGETDTGNLFITMKPKGERPINAESGKPWTQADFMIWARKEFSQVPGVKRAIVQDLSQQGFSAQRGFPVEVALLGRDWDTLADLSEKFQEKMRASGLMVDVDTDYRLGQAEVRVVPDRAKAAARGVSIGSIGNAINAMIGGVRIGKYTRGGRRYDIRIRLTDEDRQGPKDIRDIWVRNNRGEVIPLSEVVTLQEKQSLVSITRKDRQRAIRVYANVAPGKSQGEALGHMNAVAKELLPEGYRMVFSGSAATYGESNQGLLFVFILGIFVAYMVLASQYNSFIHPVTVLLALPFSITGALIALWLTGSSLNLYSAIGLILLMGIVKKNSILLVDFTNERRRAGLSVHDALMEACPIRLRPIIMTSISTISAAIPTAFAAGAGAETRAPMAQVVIGGVLLSTLLTLFVVPAAYSLFSGMESHTHDRELKEALKELGEEVPVKVS